MLKPLKRGMRVEIYWNLHRHVYSVKSLERGGSYGHVVAHGDLFLLERCKFVVRPSGRKKIVDTGVRNVHAFVRGHLLDDNKDKLQFDDTAYYSPFVTETWVNSEGGVLTSCAEVLLTCVEGVHNNRPCLKPRLFVNH